MAAFIWAEGAGIEKMVEVQTASTQFGDGYKQEGPSGLNPAPQKWSVRFQGMDAETGNDIDAFLAARVNPIDGIESFDWFPPWATAPIRVKCLTWTRVQTGWYGFSDISCTFEQRFEP